MLTAVAFLASYAVACAMAFFRHPIFGLVAYLGVFYLHPPSRWWGYAVPSVRWSFVAAGVCFLALMVTKSQDRLKGFASNGLVVGFALFIIWLTLQSAWALDQESHSRLLNYYVKFGIAMALIYKCVESEDHLRIFLWTHVLGCFYFGWSATTAYQGGRFEDFGGPGFSDANFAGIQCATGILAAAGLFLISGRNARICLLFVVPFIVNGLVTTLSRSSFIALVMGGLAFAFFSPPKYRIGILVLGAIALAGFLTLAHEQYWERISTILYAGDEVDGVDTGSSRLVLWKAQGQMFKENPLGCGHRCTAYLSPHFLEDQYLTGGEGNRARSSHNTFLSLLVEQGVVGGVVYVFLVLWIALVLLICKHRARRIDSDFGRVLPAIGGVLVAVTVSDMFVDYLILEVRIWFLALLLVVTKRLALESSAASGEHANSASSARRRERFVRA